MKYRQLSSGGDYVFGFGNNCFLTGAEAVTQATNTKLKLFTGDWWEDVTDGLPFFTDMAGQTDKNVMDMVVQSRILDTPNVTDIATFTSTFENRKYTATATVDTAYGTVTVATGVSS